MTTIKDIEPGSTITFKSKNATDLVTWRGTLESSGTYRSIKGYMSDPRAYNEAARQTDPSIPSDITELHYFLITVDNNATSPQIVVFAEEWILPGSLVKIDLAKQVTLKIDDPLNDTQKILSLLAEGGYTASIVSQ